MKIIRYKDKTFNMVDEENIVGYTEDVMQSLQNIIQTERYAFPIFSGNYGVNLSRLIGKDVDYIKTELEREVVEALKTDDRVLSISDFEFEKVKDKLMATFLVKTTGGEGKFKITQTL